MPNRDARMMSVSKTWPKVWLGSVLLAFPFFLFDTGKGLSVSEVILAVYILGSLSIWLVHALATGKKLLRWWGDFLLVLFLALSVFNVGIALLNDVELLDWISEWAVLLLMLYYFPLREVFGESERSLRQLLVLLAIASLEAAGLSAYHYATRTGSGLVYAYQILASRSRLFGPVFVLAILLGTSILFHVRSRWTKVLLTILVLINAGGLIQSFTRSLWSPTGASLVLLLAFLTWPQRLRYIAATTVLVGAAYVAGSIVAPRITQIGLRLIEDRITSSTQLTGGDYSFETRLIEADAAEQYIRMYPLGGNGIRAELLAWDPISQFTWQKSFIHIGYVSAMFKYGIPLSLILFCFIILFSWRSVEQAWFAWRDPDARGFTPTTRSVAIGIALFLPTLYLTILTAGFFDQRYGNVLFAIAFALVSIVSHQCQQHTTNHRHNSP